MANVKRVQFQEIIKAPADRVWEAMLGAETYPRWTAAFCEGSRYEGSWDAGSKMHFLAGDAGDGMVAEIAESRPHGFLSIRHLGTIKGGTEDTESDSVRAWAPAYENYTFEPVPEGTRVVVDQDMTDDFEQPMRDVWAKAFVLLKEICEDEGTT